MAGLFSGDSPAPLALKPALTFAPDSIGSPHITENSPAL